MTTAECHASKCHEPPTMRLRFMNNFTFKERPTSPLDYCDEHGTALGEKWADQGLRVFIEEIGRESQ